MGSYGTIMKNIGATMKRFINTLSLILFLSSTASYASQNFDLWRMYRVGNDWSQCPQEVYHNDQGMAVFTFQCPGGYYYWSSVPYFKGPESEGQVTFFYDASRYTDCSFPDPEIQDPPQFYPISYTKEYNQLILEGNFCKEERCGLDGHFFPMPMFIVFDDVTPGFEVAPGQIQEDERCRLPDQFPSLTLPSWIFPKIRFMAP